jgi:hypothetical protein
MKAPDWFTVPLCRRHHDLLHAMVPARMKEEEWFDDYNVRPKILADTLWLLSGELELATHIVEAHRRWQP